MIDGICLLTNLLFLCIHIHKVYFINQYPFAVNTIIQKNIAYAAQQFEIVDAIQSLFAMLDLPWLDQVDWQNYMDSSVSLAESHATIAREIPAEETIGRLPKQKSLLKFS